VSSEKKKIPTKFAQLRFLWAHHPQPTTFPATHTEYKVPPQQALTATTYRISSKMVTLEDAKILVLLVIFIAPFIFVVRELFKATDDLRQRQDAEEEEAAAAANAAAKQDKKKDK